MSYTIKKIGRYGVITPTPEGKLATALSSKLSYEKQGIQFMANPLWGIVKLYNRKKGCFPWGMLKSVENVLNQWCKYSGDTYKVVSKFEYYPANVNIVILKSFRS